MRSRLATSEPLHVALVEASGIVVRTAVRSGGLLAALLLGAEVAQRVMARNRKVVLSLAAKIADSTGHRQAAAVVAQEKVPPRDFGRAVVRVMMGGSNPSAFGRHAFLTSAAAGLRLAGVRLLAVGAVCSFVDVVWPPARVLSAPLIASLSVILMGSGAVPSSPLSGKLSSALVLQLGHVPRPRCFARCFRLAGAPSVGCRFPQSGGSSAWSRRRLDGG